MRVLQGPVGPAAHARYAGVRVLLLVAGLDVRIVTEDGDLIRELTVDPTQSYQGLGKAEGARMS